MGTTLAAYQQPIKDGLIRIFLRITEIECEIENDAPDFVQPKEDGATIKIIPSSDLSLCTDLFSRYHPLKARSFSEDDHRVYFELEDGGLFFDIKMEEVKEVWLSDYEFLIESEKPRYLKYYIRNVKHNVEWLQFEPHAGEIRILSNMKKHYAVPTLNHKDRYSGAEILMCADMLGRAIQKIDVRLGSAMVKFNTDKAQVEPLLMSMAQKLGYEIDILEAQTIEAEKRKGNSVSHVIRLNCKANKKAMTPEYVKSY